MFQELQSTLEDIERVLKTNLELNRSILDSSMMDLEFQITLPMERKLMDLIMLTL